MKKLIVVLCIAFASMVLAPALMAGEMKDGRCAGYGNQKKDETLVKEGRRNGGFGEVVAKMTEINGETAVLAGARGGWIIGRSFVIGLAGYGLVNEIDPFGVDERRLNLEMGYGGLYLGGIVGTRKLVHFTGGVLIGAGGVVPNDRCCDYYDLDWGDADVFFVVEPELGLELNVTRHFRIGAGVSYRFVSGIDSSWTSNDDLSGVACSLSLRFGGF